MYTVSSGLQTPVSATAAGILMISTVSSLSAKPDNVTPPAGVTVRSHRKISFCRNPHRFFGQPRWNSRNPRRQTLFSTHPDPEPASDSFRSSDTAPARTQTSSFSWKRLTESYPHVTPFFDEEIHNCLQLSPKDLSLLGSFGVSCGNNQFFLYGSHAFQHFLLGKMEHEDTICYILAVPGIYEERERLLANLFGFPYFKSARAKAAQPGHFGYWYRTIHTEPQNPDPISPESQPVESFSEESAENSPAARASKT